MHVIIDQTKSNRVKTKHGLPFQTSNKSELVACMVWVPTTVLYIHAYIFGKPKVALNDRHAVRGLSHLATINACELN